MKILVIPDSFKGSLTSQQVCDCIKKGIEESSENNEITTLPFSDGGEGFSLCIKNICNGNILYTECSNIYYQPIKGYIVTTDDTAIIDCSTASGLLQKKNVMQASSYGTGELIKFAYSKGFSNIILGIGGTGCCDGGIGALTALGAKFMDENYNIINRPKACDLNYIYGADFKNIVKDINFTYACDVNNIYFGENGASYVFAPQKGARKTDVPILDEGLKRLNAFFKNDVSTLKGAGAGGGICGGLYSQYGGTIRSGFDILAQYSNLEEKIKNADLVVTGEGKTDQQTLMGKLPYKVYEICKKYNTKCVVISGSIEKVKFGDKMISLTDENVDIDYAIANAEQILTKKSKLILQ